MNTEINTKKESLEILGKNLQKDVDLILSDLEKYIVDSDDDFLKAHFDVDLVLKRDKKDFKIKDSNARFSLNQITSNQYNRNIEQRTYNADFYYVKPKKEMVKNPFEKINVITKTLFSYL